MALSLAAPWSEPPVTRPCFHQVVKFEDALNQDVLLKTFYDARELAPEDHYEQEYP